MKKDRILWIDNLRAISCILIVLLHVIDGWLSPNNIILTKYSARWFIDNFAIQLIVRPSLPIFIMISGALLLNENNNYTFEKQKKYIIRMLLVLLTIGFAYCLIEEFITNGTNNILYSIGISFLHLLENKSWGAMWYIYMLIGLYIITPIIKTFVNNIDQKTYTFILGCLFVLTTIIPTLNYILGIELTDFYLKDFIYVFYFIAGYYLYKVFPKIKFKYKNLLMYATGMIGIIGYSLLLILKNFYYNPTGANRIVFVAMISICIFWLYSNHKVKEVNSKLISIISKYSFGIYLIHIFWLNIIYKGIHIFPTVFNPGIGETIIWITTIVLSLISSYILYKLPGFKKILK